MRKRAEIHKSNFQKAFEAIRKKSEQAAKDYANLIQNEFVNETDRYAKETQKVISDTNAFPELPDQDIIYSGDLKASQRTNRGRFKAKITWPVKSKTGYPYSLAVYKGFFAWGNPKRRWIAARRYPELALKRSKTRLVLKVVQTANGLQALIRPNSDLY
jgi:hypothetical protein